MGLPISNNEIVLFKLAIDFGDLDEAIRWTESGVKMKEPMKLEVRNEGIRGPRLVLDGKELHHVKEYEIKSSDFIGKAELSLKMLVTFPVNQENQ